MSNLLLSEIWIYPVKSLGGIRLEKARVLDKGLAFDRRWMLIDAAGEAMTQRNYPQMARFEVSLFADHLAIKYPTGAGAASTFEVSTSRIEVDASITAEVWGDKVVVAEADKKASRWFSDHLKTACRLVAFPESNSRPVDPDYSINEDQVSLADAFPFLLISQQSLDHLNDQLEAPVPMNRFRPNFVVSGGTPFQEDDWHELIIGDVAFSAVKKSARCTLITVDQATGNRGPEPLRTLSTFRKSGNKVYFGQNLIAHHQGEVHTGDRVIPV